MEADIPRSKPATWLLVTTALFVLAACAGPGDRPRDEQVDDDPVQLLNEIAQSLPGQYSNHAQWREDGQRSGGPFELIVEPRAGGNSQSAGFAVHQTDARGQTRSFRIEIGVERQSQRLQGLLIPMGADGGERGRCQMRFSASRQGFSGETDPEECSFGEGAQTVGLLKELAFDGQQLVIADRLLRIPSGEPAADDQIYRFLRVRSFTGWAGVRDGEIWRVSNEVQLHSEGSEIRPRDGDNQSLGITVRLARVNWREDQPPILRLSVHDEQDGELIGYAWADVDAEQVGINLPSVQVGLRMSEE